MRQAIVGAIVFVGFVLQQVFVPLHLAWNDHVYQGAGSRHVHSHAGEAHGQDGHRHDGDHHEPGNPDPVHRPHPVADHLQQLAEPALPQSSAQVAIAPAPLRPELRPSGAPADLSPGDAESSPRLPPPRAVAPARAPPLVA